MPLSPYSSAAGSAVPPSVLHSDVLRGHVDQARDGADDDGGAREDAAAARRDAHQAAQDTAAPSNAPSPESHESANAPDLVRCHYYPRISSADTQIPGN